MNLSGIVSRITLTISLLVAFPAMVNANLASVSDTNSAESQDSNAVPTLGQLFIDDRVRIKSWVQPNSNTVVGQQLELNIEIATNSWFSGGTRIGRFELDDAIVLRRNKFATNSSRRELGNSWSVQLWTITIYPQRSGSFTIPPIDIQLSVADPENPTAAISGVLQTETLNFAAALPEVFRDQGISNWVASNEFTISEEFDKPLADTSDAALLNVGDALRRTITFRAENVAAMMLPSINETSISGLAAYKRPARLEDRVNRGSYYAIRREVITYVAEQEGVYTLPAIDFYWWNTQTLSLDTMTLAAHQFRVGSAAAGSKVFQEGSWSRTLIYVLLSVLLSLLTIVFCLRSARVQNGWQTIKALLYPESQQRKRELIQSYADSDPAAHSLNTLQWLESRGLGGKRSIRHYLSMHPNRQLSALFERMMQHAFGGRGAALSTEEFAFLIDTLDRDLYLAVAEQIHTQPTLNPRHG